MPGIFVQASAIELAHIAERSRKSRRSGTTPQDIQITPLIELVRLVRPNRSPFFPLKMIRVDFFDIFGCARHNSNKFGFALACTKISEIRGQQKNFEDNK